MLSYDDEKFLMWLSSNELFKRHLRGETPDIDVESARNKVLRKISSTTDEGDFALNEIRKTQTFNN